MQEFSDAVVLDVVSAGLVNKETASKNFKNTLEKNIRPQFLASYPKADIWAATFPVYLSLKSSFGKLYSS